MNLENLEKVLQQEPRFRLNQAKKAVFQDLIEDWLQATILPLTLRQKLVENCSLPIAAKTSISNDKRTVKSLIGFSDGLSTETVLMRYADRNTVCVSSMIGCSLGCEFCATGKMGLKRKLTTDEIVDQVLFFSRYLKEEKQRVNSVVFMGMGEPFLNYDNVIAAIKILNDKNCFNIGGRHISVSTAGIVEGIKKLAQGSLQINLAISLHAANDKLRNELMPVNRQYPLAELLAAVSDYLKTTRRKVMFEYIMIQGVNDSKENAAELACLLLGMKTKLFMVNLISYNPTGIFKPSREKEIKAFKTILQSSGIETTQRYKFGQGIKAACGQLASKQI